MLELEKVKLYLRIDLDVEDSLITDLISVAESYLQDAVTDYKKNYSTDEKFAKKADLVAMVLISEMFNNRDSRNDSRQDHSYATRSMINQLNYYAESEVKEDENDRESNE